MKEDLLRALPSVDEILRQSWMQDVISEAGRRLAVRAVQELISERRAAILTAGLAQPEAAVSAGEFDSAVVRRKIEQLASFSLKIGRAHV